MYEARVKHAIENTRENQIHNIAIMWTRPISTKAINVFNKQEPNISFSFFPQTEIELV